MRYVYPALDESNPTVQYQQTKNNDDPRIFHGISIRIWDARSAVQVYMRLGRSRTS
jgi:hypothetical protein